MTHPADPQQVRHLLTVLTLAMCAVLLSRSVLRRAFGARTALLAWWLLPLAVAAALFPMPRDVAALMPMRFATHHVLNPASAGTTTGGAPTMQALLAMGWVAGMLASLLRTGIVHARIHRNTRHLASAERGSWTRRLRRLGLKGTLDVARSPAGPALLGAPLRPVLLLPDDFEQRFPTAQGNLILLHELTHLRRGDPWWILLAELARAALWFHPLAHWAARQFRLDLELACDEAVLDGRAPDRPTYARALIRSQKDTRALALLPWLRSSQLKERIVMLTRPSRSILRRRLGVAAMAVAGVALTATGWATQRPAASSMNPPPVYQSPPRGATPPVYPADAVRWGKQGTVKLDIRVGPNGRAREVRVANPSEVDTSLARAASDAAMKWNYAAAGNGGASTDHWIEVPVTFSLKEH